MDKISYKELKKRIVIIISLMLLAIVSVYILYKVKAPEEITASTRNYKQLNLVKELELPHPSKSMSLVGESPEHILFQTDDPSKLLAIKHNFSSISYLNSPFSIKDTRGHVFIYQVKWPFLYLFVGNLSQIKQINLIDHSLKIFKTPSVFTKVLLIDETRFSVLGFSQIPPHAMVLYKGSIDNKDTVTFEEQALTEKQSANDFLFGMDGFLHYNAVDNNILLIPFYKTYFQIFNLNKNKTETMLSIVQDTSQSPIRGTVVRGRYTNANPKRSYQLYSGLIGDTLLVQSKVPSKGDRASFFGQHLIIDSYSISEQQYLGSYAIPKKKNQKARFVTHAGGIYIIYPLSIQFIKP